MISQLFNIPSLNTRLKRNSTVQANPSTASLVSASRVDTGNDQSLRSSSATQAVNLESLVTQYMPGAIRRDILTINAHQGEAQRAHNHSYGWTGGANKDGLAMAIENRLQTLYPHAGHSDEAGKKALRASAKKLKLSDTHNDQLEEKLKASYCNHPLALCLKHLSTQPEASTLASIRELASTAGCATGRANQVYFALLSVDSAALFSGSSVSIIPPRHSMRWTLSSRQIF